MAVVEKLGLHLLIVVAFGLWSGRVYALELNPLQVPHQVENVNGICGTFVWPRAYDCAEFMVPTKDGFLLSVQRMFGRRFRDFDKEPVFLYHGIMQVDLLLGMYEFTPSGPQGSILLGRVCRDTKSNCYHNLQTLITGTPCCTNNSRAAYYNRFELQSTSMKNLAQMAQLLRSGRFGKYDYGVWGNLEHYWSIFPPSYDLSAIPERISFFLAHGGKDQLGDEEDVRHLVEQLPGEVKMLFMPSYNHGDFMLGTSAHVDVYPFLLEFFYQN